VADVEEWPAQWLRGVLELAALAVIADGPTYGYEIARRLGDAGLGTIKGGTLYPLLARLQDDGAISAQWQEGPSGPGRKYFSLTATGAHRLHGEGRRWIDFVTRATSLLTPVTSRADDNNLEERQ
jgi:PadR family transcriptional regulator, regulatory protein PadR